MCNTLQKTFYSVRSFSILAFRLQKKSSHDNLEHIPGSLLPLQHREQAITYYAGIFTLPALPQGRLQRLYTSNIHHNLLTSKSFKSKINFGYLESDPDGNLDHLESPTKLKPLIEAQFSEYCAGLHGIRTLLKSSTRCNTNGSKRKIYRSISLTGK